MRVQGNILFIFLGVVMGLLWGERAKVTPAPPQVMPRESRTVHEMSPTLHKLHNAKHSIYDVDESLLYTYLWNLSRELIQPNMTKVEAENAALEIGKLMQSLDSYKEIRQRKVEYAGEGWIDELTEPR